LVLIIAPLIIALREGIEVALIVVVILAYLRKSDQNQLRKFVVGGGFLAILSSVMISLVMAIIWGIVSDIALAIFEGVVVLLAAGLLTTMILWMWKTGARMKSEIESSVKKRIEMQSGTRLALLSFALVLREGVELVLFTLALSFEESVQTFVGIIIGLVLASVIGIALYTGSLKTNFSSFFKWSSFFLVLFAAGMIAYGIHELQEAGLLLIGPLEIWNINPPQLPDGSYPLLHEKGFIGALAKSLFGYNGNPSALEVIAYVSYLILVLIYYLRGRIHKEQS
jgi:high-affinity iron transporter